ncbi:MAG TPA: glutaredoxin domain-containing protein [Sporichthyaceae bacterium]|nr:glutaredoxin domain-containing protein [Sporichthyaceae bacterium]
MTQSATITVFSTSWCGPCRRLKTLMQAEEIPFTAVDIETDPEAEEFVKQVNRGNAIVPTVLFPDGTTLTNPTLAQVRAQLAAAG